MSVLAPLHLFTFVALRDADYTARDFLEPYLSKEVVDPQAMMASTCVAHLHFHQFENCHNLVHICKDNIFKQNPFLKYSHRHFPEHTPGLLQYMHWLMKTISKPDLRNLPCAIAIRGPSTPSYNTIPMICEEHHARRHNTTTVLVVAPFPWCTLPLELERKSSPASHSHRCIIRLFPLPDVRHSLLHPH